MQLTLDSNLVSLNSEELSNLTGGWSWADVGGGFAVVLGTIAAVGSGPVGWTAATGIAIGGGWMGYGRGVANKTDKSHVKEYCFINHRYRDNS